MTPNTTTHPGRARRAARLRADRAAIRALRAAHAAEDAARAEAEADGTWPTYPTRPETPWHQLTQAERKSHIAASHAYYDATSRIQATPAALEARARCYDIDQAEEAAAHAFRAERAHLMRPADPTRPNDAYSLTGATSHSVPIPIWSEGSGRLWAVFELCGHFSEVAGLVRAGTWEAAYAAAEDEIMPDFDFAAHGIDPATYDPETDDEPEGMTYRSSGTPSNGNHYPRLATACADSSDIRLVPLTPEHMAEHRIALQWEVDGLPTTTPAPEL